MRFDAPRTLRLLRTALLCTAAAAVFVLVPATVEAIPSASPLVWVLTVCICATSIGAAVVDRAGVGGQPGGVGLAVPSAFALLLAAGVAPAVVVLAAGLTLEAGVRRALRHGWSDPSVPVLAMLLSGFAVAAVAPATPVLAHPALSPRDFAAVALGLMVAFVLNVGLPALLVALSERVPIRPAVIHQLATHLSTGGVLLSVAAVGLGVARDDPALVPLLALPVAAVYRSSRIALAREHLALHDALTGLPNRTVFLSRLSAAVDEAARHGTQVAVLLIDLDRFKEVNDRLGHHVGDLLLQAIGPVLKSGFAPTVTVARMGGDEFALCVPAVDGTDEAVRIAKGAISKLTMPFAIDSNTIDIGASIGIALYPSHGEDVSTVMQRADIAMYVAKEARGGYEVYTEARDPNRRQRISSPAELRRATELGQLVLHFQPKADVRTGEPKGVEALVRWNHPTLGLVGPAEFIPMAERAGLMGPLTTFVLARSLEETRRWLNMGFALRLAVNLSVQSLYDDTFPAVVAGLLQRSNIPASNLVLDVTESTIMADPRRAQRVLAELAALGVTLAIDDFGTGYSSLAYLKQLPVSELKIDTSFVLGMATDSDDAIIVHSAIDLGQKFGLQVVAEGVESARVWGLLGRLGCDLAQGSYVCPPLPAEELTGWLLAKATISANEAAAASAAAGWRIRA